MTYRLFIDDERFPVTPDWFVARNSFQAIKALELYGMPQEIAFDHDLGGQDTAINFINHLENELIDRELKFPIRCLLYCSYSCSALLDSLPQFCWACMISP